MTKLIIKGVLLWTTGYSCAFFIVGGFESLLTVHKWPLAVIWLLINIMLCCLCYCSLSYKDCYKVSGCQWLERLIK